jgi:hypothetical protein
VKVSTPPPDASTNNIFGGALNNISATMVFCESEASASAILATSKVAYG